MSIIEAQSLTRRYGRRRGIESVDLSVPEGALFGFLGPNGAGKTTAIRVLLGFLRPTSGSALVFDRNAWSDSPAIKNDVGYLPGDLRLYSWLNGEMGLAIVSRIRRRDVRAAGRQLAEAFDLDMKVRVRRMSRGMRQKLGLILALAHRPRLLVLDEPTSGLDPLMQDRLRDHLRALADAGHTVFFSSHTLSEVEQLCDRVAIIRQGEIVADESLDALRTRAGHQVSIRFKQIPTADPPACLAVDRRNGATWSGALRGSVHELIGWLARHEVDDLQIERPELETLFRRYYDGGDEA